jgi:hypothetical protein
MATTRVEQGVTWGNLSRYLARGEVLVWKEGYKMFEGARLCSGSSRQGFGRGKHEHEEDRRIRMSMEEDRQWWWWVDGYGW